MDTNLLHTAVNLMRLHLANVVSYVINLAQIEGQTMPGQHLLKALAYQGRQCLPVGEGKIGGRLNTRV
jgi:hypothetical protein